MTGFLLDTNVALLGVGAPDRISAEIRRTVESGARFLSVMSYWEVLLKSMKGKLDVGDPRSWWPDALDALAATPLLLRPEHIGVISTLPPIHQDPFDRALIAQAIVEGLTFVTADRDIARYASDRFHVIA